MINDKILKKINSRLRLRKQKSLQFTAKCDVLERFRGFVLVSFVLEKSCNHSGEEKKYLYFWAKFIQTSAPQFRKLQYYVAIVIF